MPYNPTDWIEGQTALGPTNLNKMEQGIAAAATLAEGAVPASSLTSPGGTEPLKVAVTNADGRVGDSAALGGLAPDAYVQTGVADTAVQAIRAFMLAVDERDWVPTAWDADDRPTAIEVRAGVSVVVTVSLTYNGDGRITQMVVTDGAATVTYTVTWVGNRWAGTTKVVS